MQTLYFNLKYNFSNLKLFKTKNFQMTPQIVKNKRLNF